MGNWWLTASSPQHTLPCIMFHAEFFGKTSNHPSGSAPLQPRFGELHLLAFPKTIVIFERKEISGYWWDSGKYNRAADGGWENCVRSQDAYFEGDWGTILLSTVFLVSCLFFSNRLYFSYCMAGYLLDRPCVHQGEQGSLFRIFIMKLFNHYNSHKWNVIKFLPYNKEPRLLGYCTISLVYHLSGKVLLPFEVRLPLLKASLSWSCPWPLRGHSELSFCPVNETYR